MPTYRGRFAPSPTGDLHFGSLFAAVISYLEARHNNGTWLIRIEDIDPLREHKNASKNILNALSCHGLISDIPVTYQSTRHELYQNVLDQLQKKGFAYYCPCSRKYLHEHKGIHKPACINQTLDTPDQAIKFHINQTQSDQNTFVWNDKFQGYQTRNLTEDFVLKRKEGFYAYQLAVVCDDIEQNITHVVRGYDLLESTPMQKAIYQALGSIAPEFVHFPVITFHNGQKLSKQNKAPAINTNQPLDNLYKVFSLLKLKLKYKPDNCKDALNEALEHWDTDFLYGKSELIQDSQS